MTHEQFQQRYRYNPATDALGEGGFGKVFKAYDTHRDRWVAIKIAEVKAGQEQVRLKKEVELVNKLPSHPNIAYYEECYTFSSFAGEYDFGVLQFYEAGNLQQLAERTKLNQQQKEDILTQLLDGIAFLHSHGIIHRDLKPPNILIVDRNGEFIPKITDFGISKQLDINKSSVFNNSLAGAGTLSFASPEQLGDKTIRKNTDLWSFGVIAFWLLTGKLPFNTGSHAPTSETGRAELLRQITSGVLPSSMVSLEARWQKLIKSCLMVDAESRIHKAEDCMAMLSGKTLPPPPPPKPPKPPQPPLDPGTEIKDPPLPPVTPPQPAQVKNYTPYWLLAAAVVVIIVLLIVNSNNNAEKERMAERQRTEQLARQQQADQNAWNTAKNTNTKAAYEQYLSDYPQGRFTADARSKINEIDKQEEQNRQAKASQQADQNAWNAAKNTNTKAAYEKYLRDYPQGRFASDARSKISEAERATAGSSQGKPSIEWVNIPAGTFTMGSPASEKDRESDENQHQVTLSAFRMSKYEVTFEQYDAFCEATGRRKPADEGWGRGNRPVINVSWNDAKAFADWMGCRLPTEAEWEYAARAGTTTPFNTGNCLSTAQANYDGNYPYSACSKGEYRQKTTPVGSFPANAWGLHDMHGNVWEWCNDWYGNYPSAAQTNPKGPASGSFRVLRGGSWNDDADNCRSADRNGSGPVDRSGGIGFRLVSP